MISDAVSQLQGLHILSVAMQHAKCRLNQALDSLLCVVQTYRATGPGILLVLQSLLDAKQGKI